jgi:mono/diheme cytochrome c family protein
MIANSVPTTRGSGRAFLKPGYVAALFFGLLYLSGSALAQERREQPLPDGDGKELVAFACSQCHGLRETQILRDGEKGWEEVVNRMVLYGAQLSPSEADRVTHYLATELGPGKDVMQGGGSPHGMKNISLPDGPGKDLVATRCVLCHDMGRVTGVARSKSDWDSITRNMLRGLSDTPDEIQTMISYLQVNFSKNLQSSPRTQSESVHSSSDVFTQKCLPCHSTEPGKDGLGPSLYSEMREPHPKKTEQQVRTIIRDGKGRMPAFKDTLTEEDTENLLAYIRSL